MKKSKSIQDQPQANTKQSKKTAKTLALPSIKANKKLKPPKPRKVVHPKAKITFRHNFLPPVLGILMFVGVLGLLNGQWLVAQYQYRYASPVAQNSILTAPPSTDPKAIPQLYIPKINVTAPIVTDQKSYDPTQVQLALRKGVVQYGFSANPGQKGNVVVVGHSSGQLWAPGDYKFVFTLLDRLVKEDRIIVDYKGTRFIYRVSAIKVVVPTDLSVLQPTPEPRLTLITCTPVGTSKNRLVIYARQVSPKPETATAISENLIRPVTAEVIPN